MRAVCRSQRLICSCTLSGSERRSAAPDTSPASSAVSCSSNNLLTCSVNFSCVCRKSANVPLHSLDALDDSFKPSQGKWVPPKRCCSAQIRRISLQIDLISSSIEETKAAIVLWSGSIPHASAIHVIFSRQACSIFRDEIIPREEANQSTLSKILGSEAGQPVSSWR